MVLTIILLLRILQQRSLLVYQLKFICHHIAAVRQHADPHPLELTQTGACQCDMDQCPYFFGRLTSDAASFCY